MSRLHKMVPVVVAACAVISIAPNAVASDGGFGACCVPGVGCQDNVSVETCENTLGGSYQGDGTFCAEGGVKSALNAPSGGRAGGIVCLVLLPPNDECENALPIPSLDAVVEGSVFGATRDFIPDCELSRGYSRTGVWYSIIGTGSVLRAAVCGLEPPVRGEQPPRSVLFVYCGDCYGLQCVAGDGGNLLSCTEADRTLDPVEWCSELGREYLIFVALEGENTTEFLLSVSDTEQPCKALDCGVPNDVCEDAITIPTGKMI